MIQAWWGVGLGMERQHKKAYVEVEWSKRGKILPGRQEGAPEGLRSRAVGRSVILSRKLSHRL